MASKHYVIASTSDAARTVSRLMRNGEIPVIYETGNEAVGGWRGQPDPMKARYHVWGVEWENDNSCLISQLTVSEATAKG